MRVSQKDFAQGLIDACVRLNRGGILPRANIDTAAAARAAPAAGEAAAGALGPTLPPQLRWKRPCPPFAG